MPTVWNVTFSPDFTQPGKSPAILFLSTKNSLAEVKNKEDCILKYISPCLASRAIRDTLAAGYWIVDILGSGWETNPFERRLSFGLLDPSLPCTPSHTTSLTRLPNWNATFWILIWVIPIHTVQSAMCWWRQGGSKTTNLARGTAEVMVMNMYEVEDRTPGA